MKAFVTGASEGIGGATCRLLAERCRAAHEELRLAMSATGRKPAPETLLADLERLGARTLLLTGDVTDPGTCRSLAAQAVDFCGGLDLFVSNAGGVSPGRLGEVSVEDWDRQLALNARATLTVAQSVHEALRASSEGAIVVVASMSGMQAHPGQAAYSPAKAAVLSLVRNLAQEWAADGIRVNAVSPGMIHTPLTDGVYADAEVSEARRAMVPLGRIGRPEDIAETIVFLGSHAASYVTGQNLLVDGGLCDSLLGTVPGPR